jgi:hypothetical protein
MSGPGVGGESVVGRVADQLRATLLERGLSCAVVPSRYIEVYLDAGLRREEARQITERAITAVKRARLNVWTARDRKTRTAAPTSAS